MERGFYHPTQGYWQVVGSASQAVFDSHPEGTIETPIRPSQHHNWDGAAWVADQAAIDAEKGAIVRARRNALLSETDGDALRNLERGQPDQAMRQYREDLRDIPLQAGFPDVIEWPIKPNGGA